jgi:hypothetical protein
MAQAQYDNSRQPEREHETQQLALSCLRMPRRPLGVGRYSYRGLRDSSGGNFTYTMQVPVGRGVRLRAAWCWERDRNQCPSRRREGRRHGRAAGQRRRADEVAALTKTDKSPKGWSS